MFSARDAGRIGLGVGTRGVADAAAATCTGSLRSIEKTTNGGRSWRRISRSTPGYSNYFKAEPDSEDPNGQGDYDNVVVVDPTNPNRAVFGGINILLTSDGARKFTDIGRVYSGGFIHPGSARGLAHHQPATDADRGRSAQLDCRVPRRRRHDLHCKQ